MIPKWEYRSLRFDFNGFLKSAGQFEGEHFREHANKLGRQGWEMVNTFDTNHYDGDTRFIVAIFKRQLDS